MAMETRSALLLEEHAAMAMAAIPLEGMKYIFRPAMNTFPYQMGIERS